MKISEIKKQMLAFEDFYGGDLSSSDKIKDAKTKKELNDVLEQHRSFMECMLCDANSHLDSFKKKIGVSSY